MQTMMIEETWVMECNGRTEATVRGVGIADVGPATRMVDGKQQKHPAYQAWVNMIERAYCPKYHARKPTYEGVTVATEWLTLSTFYRWWEANAVEGFALDKDLIDPDAKYYGPDTCVYIPSAFNNLLIGRGAARGELPQGVVWNKQHQRHQAQLGTEGVTRNLGLFTSLRDACAAYEEAKKTYVEAALEKYRGSIDRFEEVASGVYLTLERQLQTMWDRCTQLETATHKEVA